MKDINELKKVKKPIVKKLKEDKEEYIKKNLHNIQKTLSLMN